MKINKKTRETYQKHMAYPSNRNGNHKIGVFAHYVYIVDSVDNNVSYSGEYHTTIVHGTLLSHSGNIKLQHREGSNHVEVMHYQWIHRGRGYERHIGYEFSLDGVNQYPAYRKPRDTQKRRLYAAERSVQLGSPVVMTMEQARKHVDYITNSRWWKSRYPHVKSVIVKAGNGNQKNATGTLAHGINKETKEWEDVGEITLPEWARIEWVILHELAHTVTRVRPAHGKDYAKNYLALVKRFLGNETHKKLRGAFKSYKIKYTVRSGK